MRKTVLKVLLGTTILSGVASANLVLNDKEVKFSKKLSLQKIMTLSNDNSNISIIIKVSKPLSDEDKDNLYKNGAKAITYAGELSYYMICSEDSVEDIADSIKSYEGIALLESSYKLEKALQNISFNDEVEVNIGFLSYVDEVKFQTILNNNSIEAKIIEVNSQLKNAKVKVSGFDLEKLSKLNEVMYISKSYKIGLIKPFSTDIGTMDSAINQDTRADQVQAGAYDLDGVNVKVGIVDVGQIRGSHREFKAPSISRVINRVSGADIALHSTHVAGIFGADGDDAQSKGMATSSKIYSYSFTNVSFANSLVTMYNNDRILLSNHSYGYTDKVNLASYDSDARGEDSAVYSNPYLNVFMAAGNDKGSSGYPSTGIIKGPANAKNILTIGALNSTSSDTAYYSSMGPVFDGRIKPDLCVRGSSIRSTSSSSDNSYLYLSGTSMATPAAAGAAALVIQEYKNITGGDIRHDMLKSILINTAIDKSTIGPDIYAGYGMIDVKSAVDTVKSLNNNSLIKLKFDDVSNQATKSYSFNMSSNGDFKATISWVDVAGNSASGKSLVNDLDIYLLSDNGTKYYPYSLNKSNPTAVAFNDRANRVDNIEQIEISNLPAGDYTLVVNGYNVTTSTQNFAIAANIDMFSNRDTDTHQITKKQVIATNNFAKVMLESIY